MNNRSMVLAEGAVEWKPLDQFPELMGATAGSQTFIPANSSGTAASQVNGPATGLIVTAVLGFMVQGLGFMGNIFGFSQGFGGTGSESALAFFTGTMGIILNLVGVAIGVVDPPRRHENEAAGIAWLCNGGQHPRPRSVRFPLLSGWAAHWYLGARCAIEA